jgi:hypothetical protein
MNPTTHPSKAAFWIGYNAFRRGASPEEAAREAAEFIGASSDEVTEAAHAGCHYADSTAFRAARF